MKSNIALIGFMGVGKTTVGEILAERLGLKFFETDKLIEQRAGMTIPEIFRELGEIAFRDFEIEVTREISEQENVVISCGGGIVLNQINIDRLRLKSIIVYLSASPIIILGRVNHSKRVRPLLNTANKVAAVRRLLKDRKPLYERAADMKVDVSRSAEDVAEKIIHRLKEHEGHHR